MGSIEQLEKKKGGYWGSTNGPDSFFEQEKPGHGYYPCQNPPWGDLWAVNVNTGKVAWRVNLGVSDIMPRRQEGYWPSQPGRAADHRFRPDLHRRHR